MAEEKETKSKKEEKVVKTVVVEQLPTQTYSDVVNNKGEEFKLVTRDDALTEILEIARQLKKGLL